jgi:flagellar hook-basal body complex protein FliE
MLKKAAADAVDTMQQGEGAAIQGVKGSMSTFKVVDAVMSAQRTLQQTLAIRDKAVSAYQDITKMSI